MILPLLGARVWTVTRYATGTYVAGEYVAGASTEVLVRGSLQPATPESLERVATLGGARVSAQWAMWTAAELVVADLSAGQRGDTIESEGDTLEVVAMLQWDRLGSHPLQHREYLLQRVGADDGQA